MTQQIVILPADLEKSALSQIEQEYSRILRNLTGKATIEERDTWSLKEAAATAYLNGNATVAQVSMIESEAAGDGTSPADLAQLILDKANSFHHLIGVAAGLKAKAKAAVRAAADPDAPIADVSAAIAQARAEIKAEADIALAPWAGV